MDALMTVLVAVLLANADGRTGALLAVRRDRKALVFCFFAAFLALAALSARGAVLASTMLGAGLLNLFAALALGSAAAALLWTGRARLNADHLATLPAPILMMRLLLIQLGDRNQLLIFALGALSGAALWSAVGATAGLLIAMVPVLALGPGVLEQKGARFARWAAAAALILWGVLHLRRAFGV
jgi:Ca2+/H+ antiporter, TMEM165/GDT1 family